MTVDQRPAPSSVPGLRRSIRTRNAVALYVSSVLGPGVLVLPGLTARLAGPGALIAWLLLVLLSLPFALTFSSLSARRPESGGVYAFAREAFGPRVAQVTGWLFALWTMAGAPAVALIAASYLGYAFPLNRPETYLLGFGIVLAAFGVNYLGISFSSKVQLAVIAAIVALLAIVVGVSAFHFRSSNFQPFLPDGILPVGTAAALIFWSFLGYENVSNVADEFENPQRDFRRSVYLSVVIVGVLYVAVALATIGTGAYEAGGGVAPFAAILGNVAGPYAAGAAAVLAAVIVFAVVNAYTTGMSRVAYVTARDGGFPRSMARLNARTRVPDVALWTLFAGASVVFLGYYLADVDLTVALLVPSGAAILVYVIGCAAGVRLFAAQGVSARRSTTLAAISLGASVVVLPFVGWPLIVSLATAVVALAYGLPGSRAAVGGSPT
ncbi:MAG: amino acid permease [Thermoplasmata archaeon]|nr:amino acid permease [Thermoplasmata archaeon]